MPEWKILHHFEKQHRTTNPIVDGGHDIGADYDIGIDDDVCVHVQYNDVDEDVNAWVREGGQQGRQRQWQL